MTNFQKYLECKWSKLPQLKDIGWRGWGQGGEMNQALYAHMNNKRKKKDIGWYVLPYMQTLDQGQTQQGDWTLITR
jgi:hypothetical protein